MVKQRILKSYSQQARWTADMLYKYDVDIERAIDFISHSYKHPLAKIRAAKRLGKLRRKAAK